MTLLPNAGSNEVSLLVGREGELVALTPVVAALLPVTGAVGAEGFPAAPDRFPAEQAGSSPAPECVPALNDHRFRSGYLVGVGQVAMLQQLQRRPARDQQYRQKPPVAQRCRNLLPSDHPVLENGTLKPFPHDALLVSH